MEAVDVVNMAEICRLCLSEEGVGVPIFGGEDDATQGGTTLSTRIMTCASLEVHAGDGLPPLICLHCQYQLDQAFKFRVQCQRSDATLRRHFNLKAADHHQQNRREAHSQLQAQQSGLHQQTSQPNHQQIQLHLQSHSQRVRGKRASSVRANPPVEVEMLNVEPEHSNRAAPREMVAEETSSSSHLSPGTEHPVHAKDHHVVNFLAKRTTWPESQEPAAPTAGVAVAYQQVDIVNVVTMKQEVNEAEPANDEDQAAKNKQFNPNQGPSRDEHLLNELNSLGATALTKSPNNCLATAMYNLKALTGEHPFSCDVCGRSFVQNHSLTRHMRTHTGERPYPCSTCGKAFIQNHSLTRHMRTHTGERPFSCTTCGRGFAEHHKLKSHVKVHTGERPYSCETCGKTFIERHTLMDHMKLHTGERNYSCAICGKSFMERHKLKRHLRSHTGERPYSCSTCGKSFVQSHNLTQHMRIHTGEQPYPCTTCGKMFGERHKLERHLRSHAKNGPYACPQCGKRFVQSHRLARHVRLHTTEAQGNHNPHQQQQHQQHPQQQQQQQQQQPPPPPPQPPPNGPPNVQPPQQPTSTSSQQPTQEVVLPRPHPQQQTSDGHGHSPPPQQPVVQALIHHPLVLPIPLQVRTHFMKDMT